MERQSFKKRWVLLAAVLVLAVATGVTSYILHRRTQRQGYNATTFAMDTIVTQTAYGPNAQQAMQEVNLALADYEARLSLYLPGSDIVSINAAAGAGGADVSAETADQLQRALTLSQQSEGAFAITIAPISLAWGVTTAHPRVVPDAELATLLPLVNDSAVQIDGNHVTLPQAGMGIDLGGIAKGDACRVAAAIYDEYRVENAILNIGGNVYVRGTYPDGRPIRVGFQDPTGASGEASIATFEMRDEVIAVSGGYERFFEVEGLRYIHIFDPRTGKPAESDIVSVGIIHPDGMTADFYSTTLFVWGKERTLAFMRNGGKVVMLDAENNLYVSESLRDSFELTNGAKGNFTVVFVPEE